MNSHAGMGLLSKEEIQRLERLSILISRKMGALGPGEQASKKVGHGMDFTGYQEYQPGDDLRYIDWNLYARLDHLYLKRHIEEKEMTIYIIVDVSRSMMIGMPSKLAIAKKVTAGLAYIGLYRFHHVGIILFSSGLKALIPPKKGESHLIHILRLLHNINEPEKTNMTASLRECAKRDLKPGLVVLISDFLTSDGYEEGLQALLSRGHSIAVLHFIAPEDQISSLSGEYRLEDVETGEEYWFDGSEDAVRFYRDRMDKYNQVLRDFCQRMGVFYSLFSSTLPVERIVWELLSGFRSRMRCRF